MEKNDFRDSQFNISMSLLQRVNILMYKYDESLLTNQLEKAFDLLCTTHDELEFSYTDLEKQMMNKFEYKLKRYLESINGFIDQTYSNNENTYYVFPRERNIFRTKLRIFNRLLRRLMNEKGMLMKQADDSSLF